MEPELLNALQLLVAEGKTPTTALLKNRVGGQFPLPRLISAIKQFNANPKLTEVTPTASPKATPTAITKLEQRLETMQQQMDKMAAQIEQLQQQR